MKLGFMMITAFFLLILHSALKDGVQIVSLTTAFFFLLVFFLLSKLRGYLKLAMFVVYLVSSFLLGVALYRCDVICCMWAFEVI